MIDKTIGEIEAKIRSADGLGDERKNELLRLVSTLKSQAAALEKSRHTAQEKQTHLKNSMDELRSSVEGFESSHPKIVQLVNNISNTLSNWGI